MSDGTYGLRDHEPKLLTNPVWEPYPEHCGCASPRYLDVFEGCWRHLADDTRCAPPPVDPG